MLIAEFDRREGWADGSTPSCARWLGWKRGIDGGAAREKVRVARALEALPLISAAMARGALSYSKVRALTRVATAETEDTLLIIALHGAAHHVETLVRRYRRAQGACELNREAIQYANRAHAFSRRPSHPALGPRRRDEAVEPGDAVPVPSSPGA